MHTWRWAFVLATLMVLGLAGPASAQVLTPDQSSYAQGENGTAAASGLEPDTDYVLQLIQGTSTTELDDDETDGVGTVNFSFSIPPGTTVGAATLRVTPAPGATGASDDASITITAAAATPTPTPTPSASPTDDDDGDQTPSPRTGGARLNVLGNDEFSPGESGKATAVAVTPNENYVLDFAQSPGTVIARATANRHGTVRFEFRIPTNARTGRATLTALPADGSGLRASASIDIVGGATGAGATGGRSLPATGREVLVYTTFGLLLLLAGLSMQRFEWLRGAEASYKERSERGNAQTPITLRNDDDYITPSF